MSNRGEWLSKFWCIDSVGYYEAVEIVWFTEMNVFEYKSLPMFLIIFLG